jgi:hypothetical protein
LARPSLTWRADGRRQSVLDQLEGGITLVRIDQRSPRLAPFRLGGRKTVLGALADEAALEMGDGAEHVEDQLADGQGGVDLLLERLQVDAALRREIDDLEQLAE